MNIFYKYLHLTIILAVLTSCSSVNQVKEQVRDAQYEEYLKNFCRDKNFSHGFLDSSNGDIYERLSLLHGPTHVTTGSLEGGHNNPYYKYNWDEEYKKVDFSRGELPYLLAHLKDDDPWVRSNVIGILGKVDDKSVVPILIRVMLTDDTPIIEEGKATVGDVAFDALVNTATSQEELILLLFSNVCIKWEDLDTFNKIKMINKIDSIEDKLTATVIEKILAREDAPIDAIKYELRYGVVGRQWSDRMLGIMRTKSYLKYKDKNSIPDKKK